MTDSHFVQLKRPGHPGLFLRVAIFEPLCLNVTKAAKILGVTRQALSTLLNGHANLSAEMALRVEKAFGVKMDTLMNMQLTYDIAQARTEEKKIKVRRYVPPKHITETFA
jgi:addiction module HigA family antidote